jgi:hypothetical protein
VSTTKKHADAPADPLVLLFAEWRELALVVGNKPEDLDGTEAALRQLEPGLCAQRLREAIARLSENAR